MGWVSDECLHLFLFEAVRILYITTVGLDGYAGGVMYSRSLCDAFRRRGDVAVLSLADNQRFSSRLFRWLAAGLQSLLFGIPPNILFHSGVLSKSRHLIKSRGWDLVVVDHLESGNNIPLIDAPVIYISHNRESALIPSKIPSAPRVIKRFMSGWIERYERDLVGKVDAVICISSEEANWYRTLNKRVVVIPPTFQVPRLRRSVGSGDRLRLGFLGAAQWLPNREAVGLLVREIIPRTIRRVELILAGAGWEPEGLSRQLSDRGVDDRVQVNCLGVVEDVQEFWRTIDVFVAPIGSGAGVNVKVCEALANGCPLIALPHALRGLDGLGRDLVRVAQDLNEFAALIDDHVICTAFVSPPHELTREYAEQQVACLVDTLSKGGSRE